MLVLIPEIEHLRLFWRRSKFTGVTFLQIHYSSRLVIEYWFPPWVQYQPVFCSIHLSHLTIARDAFLWAFSSVEVRIWRRVPGCIEALLKGMQQLAFAPRRGGTTVRESNPVRSSEAIILQGQRSPTIGNLTRDELVVAGMLRFTNSLNSVYFHLQLAQSAMWGCSWTGLSVSEKYSLANFYYIYG